MNTVSIDGKEVPHASWAAVNVARAAGIAMAVVAAAGTVVIGASCTAAGRRWLPSMLRNDDGLPQLLAFNAAAFGGGAAHALFGAAKSAEFTRKLENNFDTIRVVTDKKAEGSGKGIA